DYLLSASYLRQEDVYNNVFKRLNIGMNVGTELAKGFTIRNNMQLIISDDNTFNNSAGSRFEMVNAFPFIDFTYRDSLGHYAMKPRSDDQALNPLSEREWHQRYSRPTRLVDNVNLNFKVSRLFTVDYKFG